MKVKLFAVGAVVVLTLSGCYGSHSVLSHNANLSATQVVLAKDNYDVVKRIEGKASATSVLGIGNHGTRALVANARADMLSNASFVGGSKAVINENIEVNQKFTFIVLTTTVTVSGYLIEFTK